MKMSASFKAYMEIPPKPATAREAIMVSRYKAGDTLQQIATDYGISRERVRQLIGKHGIKGPQGGRVTRSATLKLSALASRDSYWIDKYGCNYASVLDYRKRYPKSFRQYRSQKNAAIGNRGIEWKLTFAEWIQIWVSSGHYHERGLEKGKYVMCRNKDSGIYEPGNVRIALSTENIKEAIELKRASGGIWGGYLKQGTHCKRGHELIDANIYVTRKGRTCKICHASSHKDYYRRNREKILAKLRIKYAALKLK